MSAIYEVPVDPNAENTAHAQALSLVGYNKYVLEVGCSTGFLTKVLVERGCDVIGMEIDPQAAEVAEAWAERVVVGNIDEDHVWDEVKDESFDVILLGDVLEHLRDPLASLRQSVKKLKPSGYVVTSLPNIAHGDVRMALLQGKFQYRDTGLLDRTHIHFFTLPSALQLLVEAGLVPVETKRVVMPLFQSEIGVKRDDVSHDVIDEVLSDPEAETYQFVMKSVRDNGTRTLTELSRRVNELSDRAHHEGVRAALLRRDLFDHENLEEQLKEHQKFIEALQGHASGLEHNLETINELFTNTNNELIAVKAKYDAVLGMRTVQMTAPIRWFWSKVRRSGKKSTL